MRNGIVKITILVALILCGSVVVGSLFFKSVETDAGSVANALLEARDLLNGTRDQLRAAASAIESTPPAEAYDKVANQLDQPDAMAIISPDQVRVVGLDELFRAPDPEQLQPGQQPELRFQGEEIITGEKEYEKYAIVGFYS